MLPSWFSRPWDFLIVKSTVTWFLRLFLSGFPSSFNVPEYILNSLHLASELPGEALATWDPYHHTAYHRTSGSNFKVVSRPGVTGEAVSGQVLADLTQPWPPETLNWDKQVRRSLPYLFWLIFLSVCIAHIYLNVYY